MLIALIILIALLAAAVAALFVLLLRTRSRESIAAEQSRLNELAEQRFKNLANEIMESQSARFRQLNEQRIGELLEPLRTNIDEFKRLVTDTYSAESRERFSLQNSLKEMIDLNRSIGREARELTEALRGNSKVQGDWGETILETILEKSGLKPGVHFEAQMTTGADGRTLHDDAGHSLRPDVVVFFPENRCVVIDSKVSLSAYVNLANAESDDDRRQWGRRHLDSVKAHVKELAAKNYQDYVGQRAADFVMMFIPNEAAYLSAMNLDPALWQDAYDKRVLIVSPTHLISVIRLVEQLWRQDDIKRNVINIANEGGKMYDKFVGFLDDMARIERSLTSTRTAFDDAMRKLRDGNGNLISRAEKLRTMGAKTAKNIPTNLLPDD